MNKPSKDLTAVVDALIDSFLAIGGVVVLVALFLTIVIAIATSTS